jgi:hypothetical protein
MTRRSKTLLALCTLALCTWLGVGAVIGAAPVSGRIVDEQTHAPIAGAHILAMWQLNAFPVMELGATATFQVHESVSDADGRFSFPGWTRFKRPWQYVDERSPELYAFKGAYEPRILRNRTPRHIWRAQIEVRHQTTWSGEAIALRRDAGAPEHSAQGIDSFGNTLKLAITQGSAPRFCWWHHAFRIMTAVAQARTALAVTTSSPFTLAGQLPELEKCGQARYLDRSIVQ